MPNYVVEIKEEGNAERLLNMLPEDLQQKALPTALRAAARPIKEAAQQIVTQPGYQGDLPGLMPLRDTIIVVIRRYEYTTLAYVGTMWPEGNHGFLVEFGHDVTRSRGGPVVGHARPHPFMRPAVDQTEGVSATRLVRGLSNAVSRYNVGNY